MFNNLRKATEEHKNARIAKFAEDLKDLNAEQVVESWYYRRYTTPGTFDALKALPLGSPIPEAIAAKMLKKYTREEEKSAAARLEQIEAAERAPEESYISIGVEWSKSRTWGMNPTATVSGQYTTTGHASGCGYDKQSAAIASAFNDNTGIMSILYRHADNGGVFPYGVHIYAGIPSFDGGCGVSTFRNIFHACGYTFNDAAHGKLFDAYTITK